MTGEPHEAARERFLSAWGGSVAGAEARALLEERTASCEAVVLRAWNEHVTHASPEGLALIATGGFGRREQFPHSDVDLLILTAIQELAGAQRDAVAEFTRALWDAGMRVSQSVHTPPDCCELNEQNIELAIALLSERYLAGDRGLYATLKNRLPKFLFQERQALARHLCRMARARHAKHGGAIFQLEPNIKEGPGGLRDFHTVCWLEQLRAGRPEQPGAPSAAPQTLAARDFLFALRCWLHLSAGRDMNTLTFTSEEEIAALFHTSAAGWMRTYYGHAREIRRAALRAIEAAEEQGNGLLAQFRDWRSRVSNADFLVSRERVYFRSPSRIEYEPPLVLSLFEFAARHGLPLASDTERRVREYLPRLRQFFAISRASLWPRLRAMLSGSRVSIALRGMHETGVLEALFPEFEPADCLVVRDFYHRYTVDEHTLVAIEELENLGRPRAQSDARFTALFAEAGELALLKFALLFHDLGKAASPGREHVGESARLATAAAERIGMPAAGRRTVRELIEQHLELSDAMNRRDLDDAATVRLLADRVGTVEHLKLLTLMTYADVSAVHPGAMTPWRLEQLWSVYVALHTELTRELNRDRIAESPTEGAEFAAGFPKRYLRTHSAEDIQADADLVRRAEERGIAVDLRPDAGFWRLRVVTQDRPALLASIAGALAGFGLNIVKAEGFSNRAGVVLDTFVFTDPHRTLELNPPELDRLRVMLERVVLKRADVRSLLENRPKPAAPGKRSIRPSIAFDDEASSSATLVEIVADDRPGLLYSLASAVSSAGASLELVLVNTQAHKAMDVFYVTLEGRKLAPEEKAKLEVLLRQAITQG
ncbi:MAG TPA: HD domain-containing protein [Bryobacteraceae bacterium]|nr:HD domain-containing protein [Bryobacteraceae bacterium]